MMKNVIFIHLAMFSALAAAIPRNIDSFTPAPVAADIFKREIASNENWCHGQVHQSEGDFKPTSAVCNWALDRSFSVYCEKQNVPVYQAKAYWIQGYCPVGTLCEQRQEVPLWTGRRGFDVDCVPSRNLVKWAIGSRDKGNSFVKYCSNRIGYPADKGGRTPVYQFFAEYFGITGQKTQINKGFILWNGNEIQFARDSNQIGTRHAFSAGDYIQYCGVRGSDALIEGYATATLVSYLNADGTEEEVPEAEANDFTMVDLDNSDNQEKEQNGTG